MAGAKRIWAVRLVFIMSGIGISVWAITVPFIKIKFLLPDGTLGLMLLAGGTGGVLSMPGAGMLVARFGSRAVVVACGVGVAVLMPALVWAPSPLVFTLLLFVYGALFGALDIAINAQGAVAERQRGEKLLSGFHACYSLGSLGVAVCSSLLLRLGLSIPGCAALDAAAVLIILVQARHLVGKAEDAPAGGKHIALPNRATLLLGLCCFVCFLTEGAATDWSTIFMRFSRGMALASAALGYAAFAVTMAGSRLLGDRLTTRLGPATVVRAGCVLAVVGFGLVTLVPWDVAGILGFGLVGLGIGNIAPLVFSAAAKVKGMAANHSVPAVVGLGYAGFLLGPVGIGLLAEHFSLGFAFGADALLIAAVFFVAEAVAA